MKLIHSLEKGKVMDLIDEVKERYINRNPAPSTRVEFWTFQRKDDPVKVRRGQVIRIPADRPFQLRWSDDSWQTTHISPSAPSVVPQLHLVEVDTTPLAGACIDFTFYWLTDARWEGRNFSIGIKP